MVRRAFLGKITFMIRDGKIYTSICDGVVWIKLRFIERVTGMRICGAKPFLSEVENFKNFFEHGFHDMRLCAKKRLSNEYAMNGR